MGQAKGKFAGLFWAKCTHYTLHSGFASTKPPIFINNIFRKSTIFLIIAKMKKKNLFWNKHGQGFQMIGV